MPLVKEPTIVRVSQLPPTQINQLPQLYYRAWSQENLCASLQEADKVLIFDPEWSFALTKNNTVLGLINTLPLSLDSTSGLSRRFSQYSKVEIQSQKHIRPKQINCLLCFSLVGLPNAHAARTLISFLRSFPYTIAVYTRPKSVPMHIHLGANPTPIATLLNSRPEDIASSGSNIILVYPHL